jgi:heptosyltransferase-2
VATTKRILVLQTAFLGDLLLTVPLFKYLKSTFPQCEISLVCRKGFGSVFKDLKLVDKTYEIQKKNKESYHAAQKSLQSWDFDLLLSPHESMTTALFARKIKARKKIGFRKWWNAAFFTSRVPKDLSLPDALRQMSLLQECDPQLKQQLLEFRKADSQWTKQDQTFLSPVPAWASPQVEMLNGFHEVQAKFSLPNRFVCFFPGSVWKTKQWTEEGFAETGKQLAAQGRTVVLMGGPGEEVLAAKVSEQIFGSMNLAGQTSLKEGLSILSRADVVVTNDSAGQHMAALVGAPTVAVFGPTVLSFGFRPWNSKAIVVERKGLGCRPCGKHGHHKCPIGTHECMTGIQAAEVLSAIGQIQQTPAPQN